MKRAGIILLVPALALAQPAEPTPDNPAAIDDERPNPPSPPPTPSPSPSPLPSPSPPPSPPPPPPSVPLPELLRIPTGWLLPAAVLYSRTSLDTGGGVSSDNRVGLGDVAEFGVATSDTVRMRDNATSAPKQIQPYFTATFRLGVAEDRLFPRQPGIVLGFRKSFERSYHSTTSRIAELTLVASGHVGPSAAYHLGVAFWDAELRGQHTDGSSYDETLHGYNQVLGRQVRTFGGLEVSPLEHSQILIDFGWSPELCKDCAPGRAIRLRPELAWGVRYHVTRAVHLESGVRVPDIGNANLLEAQIFGQVTFTSWALRRAVDQLK